MSLFFRKSSYLILTSLSFLLVFGIALLVLFFRQPSEAGNQFLFGLSVARLSIGSTFLLLIVITASELFYSYKNPTLVKEQIKGFISSPNRLFFVLTSLYGFTLLMGATWLLTLIPVAKGFEWILGGISRINYVIVWLFTAGVLLGFVFVSLYKEYYEFAGVFTPFRRVFWFWIFLCIYILLVTYYRIVVYASFLKGFETPLLSLGLYFFIWSWFGSIEKQIPNKAAFERFFLLVGIFLTVFVLYWHIADWVDWIHKNRFEYWDSLARQFLNGKLYLFDASVKNVTLHDLTLYDGKWYVPVPPLPAILLIPIMLFANPENIFMGDVSMLMGALNAVLVYLILEQFIIRRWVKFSQTSHFLLVALFAFGTNHLWVSIMGEIWFVSQVLTVTFLALTVLAALREASPWIVGVLLGVAMWARPNSLMTWPFIFAIAMQIQKDKGVIVDLKYLLKWSIESAAPVGVAIVGLLSYNYVRFENFLDFGYVSINGAPDIVNNAQRYGIFSPVYIFHNLDVMFLYTPQIQLEGPWLFVPSLEGMSIFLSTPMLIYLFRRYENHWWIWGAWASIFFGFALLVMYHNTGSAQFGYRYILDLIIPIMSLLSLTFQEKKPWHYNLLLVLSILINLYGIAWFVNVG